MRKERGELDNHFIAEANGPDHVWKFYAVNVALTAAAGLLVLAIHGIGGGELQTASYIVIPSRSAERRGGEEGRSRWWPYPLKKNIASLLESTSHGTRLSDLHVRHTS